MDNNKTNQYLVELTMYLTHLDPLVVQEKVVSDKIVSLCV